MQAGRRYLFELSLEHPDFPLLELRTVSENLGDRFERIDSWLCVIETAREGEVVDEYAGRLAFSMRVSRLVGEYAAWESLRNGVSLLGNSIRGETACVRISSREDEVRKRHMSAERELGSILSSTCTIRLEGARNELRVLICGKRFFLGLKAAEIDRTSIDSRQVKYRAFFSPISLSPRFARGLLNICGAGRGKRVLDPFCGTGGILIEAALLGAEVVGSDIDPKMIEGTEINMRQAGAPAGWELHCLDVGRIGELGVFDAVVTDPPYGRSSYYNKENLRELYARAMQSIKGCLADDGVLGIVVPEQQMLPEVPGMELEISITQKVHRSLMRNYLVFRKTG